MREPKKQTGIQIEYWNVERELAKAKHKAYDELYDKLDAKEGERIYTGWQDREIKLGWMCSK